MNEYTKAELDFACAVLLQRFQEGTRSVEYTASQMLRCAIVMQNNGRGVDEARKDMWRQA